MSSIRQVQFKKVVAVCLLEAVKTSLEQLVEMRLEVSRDVTREGAGRRGELTRLYGGARRLRDYLQRSVSSGRELVDVELGDESRALIVACARHMVDISEHAMQRPGLRPADSAWLREKIRILSEQAVEFAVKPLVDLPVSRPGRMGQLSRELSARIQDKIYGRVDQREKIVPPSSPGLSLSQGIQSFGDQLANHFAEPLPDEDEGPLLDHTQVRDTRLRALVALDLKSLGRAQRDGDFRVASVVLASIVEAVALDHLVPRRFELGLTGGPDTWDLPAALVRAMGDAAQEKDEAWCRSLYTARNVLQPAKQLLAPFVATATSFDGLTAFVARLFEVLGYTSSDMPIRFDLHQTEPSGDEH